jgi:F-type H+-transporting ATPase subunit delta
MAIISNHNVAQAIYLSLKDKPESEQPAFFKNVVRFLARRRLLSKAPDILERLNKIINDDQGKISVKVSSVEKINESAKKEITHNLAKHYGGKTVILEENLNNKLIGGYKIEVNDEVIDFSIKNRIEKLQAYLTNDK